MSNIDNYYRSALVFTQAPPTTQTVSSNFNYSIAHNLYGTDILLYTGLIPSTNPLINSADGAKYSARGSDILEKVSVQVLNSVEESFLGFTHPRLTYITPGLTYEITVWSKDAAGDYTVVVPPSYYDIFFYPQTDTYAIYFKDTSYAPMYRTDDFVSLKYPPAITCYRYCGPKGIENAAAQIGVGTYIPDAYELSSGTGLYNTVTGDYQSWILAESESTFVPPGSSADSFTTITTTVNTNTWQRYVYDFGTSICVGDLFSPYMKKTIDAGETWTDRDLTSEATYASSRTGGAMIQDPITKEVYTPFCYVANTMLKFNEDSASYLDYTDQEWTGIYNNSIVALDGVLSLFIDDNTSTTKRMYTADFSTFEEATGPAGFTDYPGNMFFKIVDPDSGRIWANPYNASSTTGYISTDNGITYDEFTAPAQLGIYTQLSYSNGVYVMSGFPGGGGAGSNPNSNAVYTSTDLITWSTKSTGFSISDQQVNAISLGSNVWIATQISGNASEISISTDNAATWNIIDSLDPLIYFDAIKIGTKYYMFAFEQPDSESVYSSTDLENWALEVTFNPEVNTISDYNVPGGSNYRWRSSFPAVGYRLGLHYAEKDGNLIIGTGNGIQIYDGTSWTSRTDLWNTFSYYGLLKIK